MESPETPDPLTLDPATLDARLAAIEARQTTFAELLGRVAKKAGVPLDPADAPKPGRRFLNGQGPTIDPHKAMMERIGRGYAAAHQEEQAMYDAANHARPYRPG